ncbi:MAG: hypothetical protein NVS1B5_10870 [Gemmatimonadaceae bacterium]
MRVPVLLFASAASFLVADCAVPVPAPAAAPSRSGPSNSGSYGATEARIFDLINAQRQHQGLAPLISSEQLNRMAQIQADNMAHFHKMAHTIPEAQLPTLGDRARHVGYSFERLAENVAVGFPNAESVVQGWMSSRLHRQTILVGGVVETGIGIAKSSAGGLYYCQVFGSRRTTLVY